MTSAWSGWLFWLPKDSTCCVIYMVYLATLLAYTGADWQYRPGSEQGPSHWMKDYPLCAETQQSPIDIDTTSIWHSSSLHAFDMQGYESIPRSAHWEMYNTGHTVEISIGGDYLLREGGLDGDYKISHISFHWGADDFLGSEHTIDGMQYPMEVLFIHYKSEHGSLDQAYMHESGVCILSFLVELSGSENLAFNQITNNLQNISFKDEKIALRPVPLFSLLPLNLNQYYRYQGSLTQPPCYESVVWSIFKNHIRISRKQLKNFRTKLSTLPRGSPYEPMINNFRSVQPIGSRHVYSSDPADASFLTAPLESPFSFTLAVFLGLIVILLVLRVGNVD